MQYLQVSIDNAYKLIESIHNIIGGWIYKIIVNLLYEKSMDVVNKNQQDKLLLK